MLKIIHYHYIDIQTFGGSFRSTWNGQSESSPRSGHYSCSTSIRWPNVNIDVNIDVNSNINSKVNIVNIYIVFIPVSFTLLASVFIFPFSPTLPLIFNLFSFYLYTHLLHSSLFNTIDFFSLHFSGLCCSCSRFSSLRRNNPGKFFREHSSHTWYCERIQELKCIEMRVKMLIKILKQTFVRKYLILKSLSRKVHLTKKKFEHYISTWFQKLYVRDFPIFMFWISMFEVFTVKVVISFSSVKDDD